MKNKILIGCLAVATLFGTQSCEDNLDIQPNSSLIADTAFKNVEDLQNALNSAYANYDNNTILFNSIFTDNTKVGVDNGGQQLTLHRLVLDPTTGVAGALWTSRYAMINKVNRIMEAAGQITIPEGREDEVDHILGQAYALRAFAHFELFQYFTPDYQDPNGLSVPAVETVVTVENLPRNTVSEVYTLMNSDLDTAASLLDSGLNDVKYITPDFITALRARMALFAGEYSKAKGFAETLINKYALADQAEYVNMFLDLDDTEVIFEAARVIGDARPGYIWHFSGGGPFIEMSNSLFNELETEDVRYGVLFNADDSDPSANLHLINKYPGTAVEFLADVKVFRVSEMYLIKAEAEMRSSMLEESKATLKELRDARFGMETAIPSYSSLNEGLDFLLEERRIELAFEGHRYLDLKRLNRDLVRAQADCGNLDNACEIPSSDKRFTLPIPLFEMNANPLMVQNPGY
jgi:starch-binding outer membrane protein, SusD/RagB family